MFDLEAVPVSLRKLALRIVESEEGALERQCEITFRIAVLTYDLASKIRLPIVAHCFGKDRLPLWGVHEVHFAAPEHEYRMQLDPALGSPDAIAFFAGAVITKVRVWRPNKEKRELALEFVVRHALERQLEPRGLGDLLTAWEMSEVYATLAPAQPGLHLEPEPREPEAGRERRAH